MRRILLTAAVLLLSGALVAADDPKPVPARVAVLEEELETLEAQRDVKKAYVKAAEVGAELTKDRYEHAEKSMRSGGGSFTEVQSLKYEHATAKALLVIRQAELREVEVKVKHAKKRLDDAKKLGAQPQPQPMPVPMLEMKGDTIDEKLAKYQTALEREKAELAKREAEMKAEIAKLKKRVEELRKNDK